MPKKDMRVQDVFERADNAMYENKHCIKGSSKYGTAELMTKHDDERSIRFYELFEQLTSAMTEIGRIDIPLIEKTLIDISLMFRLSKGVTRLYRNPQEEIQGGGETLCCFDTGREGKPVISLRVVTSIMSIATLTVYMTDDVEPLTDDERWKVELVMRTTLSFVSRNRLRDIVEELAFYDDDGYPNLRSLINYLTRYLSKCMLGGKVAAHYNLRHYSLINEQVGRETGDKIMKMHFDKLKSVIGEDGLICRLGGDNFVAVFEKNKFNAIKELLTEAVIVYNEDGDSVKVRTTAGVFVVPDDYSEQNPGEVMGKIVTAYRAAQSGGNEQIVIYNDELAKSKEKSMRVQQLFNDGLKNKEFHAFYQPKVDVRTGDICGAEALCRWIRNGKIIPPAEFIPSLEKTTDICRLDLYMLEEVCADLRRWLDEGRNVVRISFNMSRKHLLDPSIVQRVIRIIDKHDVPHELIEVELTETVTNVEFNDLKRVVTSFKQEGIFTSIDDFGTGFSSMNLLNDIPWDCIKIDRSLLPCDGEEENSRKMIMFSHITSLSAKLGLECIAEGVETEEQLGILRSLNCDYAQGFYFDRPISVEEFEKRLDMGRYSK
jgi:EAL domain-containing protein (putative c-di-GMP-specific phosphodiesterase class I)/GGDEF domain-containing protein